MAVWLYKVTVATGQFAIVQDSITTISEDQRIQLLLIGFAFNAFLEACSWIRCTNRNLCGITDSTWI